MRVLFRSNGATGGFTPNPATTSSTLSVSTSPSTPTGTYTLTITGVGGSLTRTTTVTLVVNAPPNFTLSAAPASRTVTQGGSTSYAVTISPTGGFTDQVTLSVSGLPTGATGSFTPNPATASSTPSLTTTPRTTTVTLVVNAPPNFTLSAAPASRTVGGLLGRSTSYSVTISSIGGFTGQVTLSVSGLPNGATGSFTPNPATASSTLSVTTGLVTLPGTYTLT